MGHALHPDSALCLHEHTATSARCAATSLLVQWEGRSTAPHTGKGSRQAPFVPVPFVCSHHFQHIPASELICEAS